MTEKYRHAYIKTGNNGETSGVIPWENFLSIHVRNTLLMTIAYFYSFFNSAVRTIIITQIRIVSLVPAQAENCPSSVVRVTSLQKFLDRMNDGVATF